MKKGLVFCALFSLLLGLVCAQNSYRFSDDYIEVLLPSEPYAESQSVDTDAGTINFDLWTALDGNMAFCNFAYTTYDEGSYDVTAVLEGALSGVVESLNAQVISSANLMKNGATGKRLIAHAQLAGNQTMYVKAELYFKNQTLYQFMYISFTKEDLSGPVASNFFASLKIK